MGRRLGYVGRVMDALAPTSSGERFAALDGFRALAVLAVVLSHLEPLQSVTGVKTYGSGGMAVCMFFVLSAFLLYYPWAAGKRVSVAGYYNRRVKRILPAYYLAVLFGLFVLSFVGRPVNPLALFTHAAFVQLYVPTGTNLVPPAWSLLIEVQFYLALPLLAYLARRSWVLALYVLGGCLAIRYLPFAKDALHMSLPFACGMVAAWAVARRVRMPAIVGYVAFTGLCAYQVLWLSISPLLYSPAPTLLPLLFARQGAIPSVLAALVVAAVALHGRGLLARALAWRPLRCVGICGYGTFLFHQMTFTLLAPLGQGVLALVVGLGAALALGVLSYLYVEAPAMRWRKPVALPATVSQPVS